MSGLDSQSFKLYPSKIYYSFLNWHGLTSHDMLLPMLVSARVFLPGRTCFGCKLFPLLLKQNMRGEYILIMLYYLPYHPVHSILGFGYFFATNFQCDNCAHVRLNTGRFFFSVIKNKCISCNLITSTKMVPGLCINYEGYFSHCVNMKLCIASTYDLLLL